ncbi:MAG TPA: WecB/TagA/CpsF family glycosyltransferase [Solirubrobacteraceae bacterium]|nr:WecB/TagA/CpsF family glycosyltransferase [Solirubrobacteraceae bacterium]
MNFVDLMGTRFAAVTEAEAAAWIVEQWRVGEGGWVSTPNTHQLRLLSRERDLRALVARASLVVADGMPLIWASALQATPLPERVAGSSLVWSLAREAARARAPLFLLGGDPGVAERAAARLEAEIPGIMIAGTHCPPLGFERDERERAEIIDRLRCARPAIVYVGLGFPKQERLIIDLCPFLPATWFLGIGISLSFISGDQRRAPAWVQKAGLEWAHRLSREPGRLFRRYVIEGIPFTVRLLFASARRRLAASP